MLEIAKIVELAKEHATPMYLFDLDELQSRVQAMKEILGEDIQLCYAMKANPFLVDSMKQAVHKFEVCSPGESSIVKLLPQWQLDRAGRFWKKNIANIENVTWIAAKLCKVTKIKKVLTKMSDLYYNCSC